MKPQLQGANQVSRNEICVDINYNPQENLKKKKHPALWKQWIVMSVHNLFTSSEGMNDCKHGSNEKADGPKTRVGKSKGPSGQTKAAKGVSRMMV